MGKKKRLFSMVLAIVLTCSVLSVCTDVDAATTPVARHGKLSVRGTQLVDKNGQAVILRGVSTHGLQWYAQYNNKEAYRTLRDDWGASVIRLAMYVEEGGYMSNPKQNEQEVTKGVDYATELGMYAIIDWHILNGNTSNPKNYQEQAKQFFAKMAKKYKDHQNVIYEICNEPNNCSWDDIKAYAEAVIATIRQYDKDAIIIVGTPTWSQLGSAGHLYEPADRPIDKKYSNIMYTFHFYASDPAHNQWLSQKIETAIAKGLPVFVTEFGLSQADGNGTVDTAKAKIWLERCEKNKVSYCVWSLSNDFRSSSMIKNSCSKTSGWTQNDLTPAGQYIRNWYRSKREKAQTTTSTEVDNPKVPNLAKDVTVSYRTFVQKKGWKATVKNAKASGAVNTGKKIAAIRIKVSGNSNLGIRYKTKMVAGKWQPYKTGNAISGTAKNTKAMELIRIELTGKDKAKYDVYYRVHVKGKGWLGWAKNGKTAGSSGKNKGIDGINIAIQKKGKKAPGKTTGAYVKK
ncbi:MAG: cellulase family glycosylhydrolase [Wujia sp.]